MRFKNNVVLIFGGTSGIGLATAVQFIQEGAAQVVVCGRMESKWQEAQTYINQKLSTDQKKQIEYWSCDVRIESQVKSVIEKMYEKFGRLDVCFNNAGVAPGIVGSDSSLDKIQFESYVDTDGSIIYRLAPPQPGSPSDQKNNIPDPSQTTATSPFSESPIATSCMGMFYCLKWETYYFFQKQPKELPFAIINTASRNGVLPDSHRPLYAASKAFILSLTKSMANQVAQRSLEEKRAAIRINAVSPGPIDTPLEFGAYGLKSVENKKEYEAYVKKACAGVPLQRTGKPEEIAPTVLFLADYQSSSYITGANICVDGGHTGSPLLCVCE